jgi:hypothetical protein
MKDKNSLGFAKKKQVSLEVIINHSFIEKKY